MKTVISTNDFTVHEIIVNKSRFITYLVNLTTIEAAKIFFERIRQLHPQATHHITLYIIGSTGQYGHFNDDNEPSGTAGKPAFDVLRFNDITNVGAVIVRYYGGVKLGAGGLTRAYSRAISETLKNVEIAEIIKKGILTIKCAYSYHDIIINLLKDYQLVKSQYNQDILLEYEINARDFEKLKEQIISKATFDIDVTLTRSEIDEDFSQ